MSKLRIRLSDSRTLDFSVPEMKQKDVLYLTLNSVQLLSAIVFVFLLVRTTILNQVQYLDIFDLVVGELIILIAIQGIKAVISGVKFFPESKFDLPALLLAIGLISTLLLKQILDLDGNEGMLPNQSAWHYTILGILLMSLISYLVDVAFRKRFMMKNVMIVLLASLEVLAIFKYIVDGEIFTSTAYMILVLLPIYVGFGFDIKGYYLRGIYFVNLLLVGLLGLLNLDLELAFVYVLALITMLVVGFVRKDYMLEDVRQLVQFKKGSLKFRFEDSAMYALLNAGIIFVSGLTIVLNLLFSDRTLGLLRSGMEHNVEIFRGIGAVEFLIGGNFNVSGQTFVSNIYLSYGLLGITLVVVYFVGLIFATRYLVKNSKKNKFLIQGIAGSIILFGFLSLFFNFSMQVLVVFFLLGGLVANLSAREENKELKFEYLKIQGFKQDWQRIGVRVLQIALIVGIIAAGIYGIFNIEEIFLS